ncbi:MAG TPA: PHB depolymerase family esterase [Methylomirabilota bacterium]|nr:PHB depolymerase family esterase [Methylomirabilota bacterium]
MRPVALAVAWLLAAASVAAAERPLATHTLEVDGLTRTYHVYVPPGLGATPAPLVLVFHGGGSDGPATERLTRFTALADREGFVVVLPDGVGRNWNDGREIARSRAHRERVDDVAFVAALLDAVGRRRAIDPRRVYATGISNGGIFSHYLAARLAGRIVAIAPVVGGIADPPDGWLRPQRPVSVLILQGTADPLVPYHGGPVAFGRGRIIDTEEAARRWAALNGAGAPREEALPAGPGRCGGRRTVYPDGRDGTEVVLVRLDGGGHAWPGAAQYLPARLIGPVCRDFDATRVIWEFFKAHPRPGGP